MNIELEITDPFRKPKSGLLAIYRIDFDNGKFYIGSSADLYNRARTWKKVLLGTKTDRFSYKHLPEKVSECKKARISVLFYVQERDDLLKEEELQLQKNASNPNMINVFHYTKCEVIQFNMDGEEIMRFNSIKEAGRILGTKYARIRDVMSGRKGHWRGFVFRYADQYANNKNTAKYKKKSKIMVNKFTLDGQFICGYKNKRQAALDVGVDPKGVTRALSGRQKTSGGFIFKYA